MFSKAKDWVLSDRGRGIKLVLFSVVVAIIGTIIAVADYDKTADASFEGVAQNFFIREWKTRSSTVSEVYIVEVKTETGVIEHKIPEATINELTYGDYIVKLPKILPLYVYRNGKQLLDSPNFSQVSRELTPSGTEYFRSSGTGNSSNPVTAQSAQNPREMFEQASLLWKQGRKAESVQLTEESVRLFEQMYGTASAEYADMQRRLEMAQNLLAKESYTANGLN